jgi:DNA-binding response OmpR family regulator
MRVLVVDDDTVLASLLAEMLMEIGYDVCATEATQSDAVAAAARCRPGLMIIDARLGEGSGVAAVAEITRWCPVPHVFISGDRVQGAKAGSVVLLKPFREPELVLAIERALNVPAAA